ncbi:hypothetical protein [Mobilicoccus pelagius]|uniref:Uncharacterized protein n=1 Tax=Mobilicoccus pelagius NBRC 104925 TaxID=1089455 RepID=H5UU19_9MICO|nr:hypothetical protein [Mobilicoccus pelagius]GAB49227.1 hypothetical protein MOPEL_099_00270 [Mobilicoccus pelagius NBRC 104925]
MDEYDDLFEVMGYSGEGFGGGQLGAAGLVRVGAEPGAIRTVSATGASRATAVRVRLVPMSARGTGVRVLRVLVPDEPAYLVEYRTPAGRDARIVAGSWRPSPGVRVLRETADGASVELDATPGGRRYDRSLPPGVTFVSHSGAVRITVAAQDAGGADLVLDASEEDDPPATHR